MKQPKIELMTEKTKLAEGAEQNIDVLVRVTPPEIETPSERPKMNLSLVLDRSGSMGGEKIEQAKAAAAHCIEQLLPIDRVSLVIFDDSIETLIPSAPAGNPELYKRLIAAIRTGGSTALHEAWVRGGIEVSEHLEKERVNRVILITDGQANVGETRIDRIVAQTGELARRGVSTSTIGIGRDFAEDLLVPMAEAGEGNPWHVEEAADMVRIFETELGGALNQIGREVSMKLTAANGVRITDVMNDFARDDAGNYLLPNLIAGRPLEIVVRVKVPAGRAGESMPLFDVELAYTDQRSAKTHSVSAALTAEFDTAAAVEALAVNADVGKAVVLLSNARARAEAIEAMDQGDYEGALYFVQSAYDKAERVLMSMPTPELSMEVSNLRSELDSLGLRDEDVMTRKKLMYQAHQRRHGR